MLDQLPTELQEEIIYYLIDLDSQAVIEDSPLIEDNQGLGSVRNPYSGRSGTARSFGALSQVNSKLRRACESFCWKTIRYSQPRDFDEHAGHPNADYLFRHVRALQGSVLVSDTDGSIDAGCLSSFVYLREILQLLSQRRVKHIRLYTPAELDPTFITLMNDPENLLSRHLRISHNRMTSSLSNFTLLTSLDISGACYAFIAEEDIARCIWELPNLTRFRAYASESPSLLNNTDSAQLGESLASRCSLEYLSLEGLQTVSGRWCRLNWRGPLKVLFIKHCWNIQNDWLYGFISSIPTLKKIRIEGQTMQIFDESLRSDQKPFQSLESFTFLGFNFDSYIFRFLSRAPKLEKFHMHLAKPRKALLEILDCIDKEKNAWPSLRSVILSQIFPEDQQRISLENWGRERQISFKFHHRLNSQPGTPESEASTENPMEVDQENQDHAEPDDVPLGSLHIETVDAVMADHHSDASAEAEIDLKLPGMEGAVPDLASDAGAPEENLPDDDSNLSTGALTEDEEDFADDMSEISIPCSDDSELSGEEDWTSPSWIRDHE